jgi:hypothetical protein
MAGRRCLALGRCDPAAAGAAGGRWDAKNAPSGHSAGRAHAGYLLSLSGGGFLICLIVRSITWVPGLASILSSFALPRVSGICS